MTGYVMRVPIIRVKDKYSGRMHIVGTGCHDSLTISDGGIQYYNLQCGDGTGLDGGYEFVGVEDDFMPFQTVEFVSIEQLLDIYAKEVKLTAESEKALREWVISRRAPLDSEVKKSEDSGIFHT